MSGEIIAESINSLQNIMRRLRFRAAFILAFGCVQVSSEAQSQLKSPGQAAKWVLTWSDEFEGSSGSRPDPAKWVVESGGSGWGNDELEYYTDRSKNVRQQDGNLVIEAVKEKFVAPDHTHHDYTSVVSRPRAGLRRNTDALKRELKFHTGRDFGRLFGCSGRIFRAQTGRPAGKSTSWKKADLSR